MFPVITQVFFVYLMLGVYREVSFLAQERQVLANPYTTVVK